MRDPAPREVDRRQPGDAARVQPTGAEQGARTAALEQQLPWLRGYVERRVGAFLRRHAEASDYLQDAVAEFLRHAPPEVLGDPLQVRALLLRIVENTLRDKNDFCRAQRRDLARNATLPSEGAAEPALRHSSTPSRVAGRHETRDRVRLGLEMLCAEDRKILLAREYEGRSFVEIGAELGMTANAVRMRWVRAVARLAEGLKRLHTAPRTEDPT